MRSLNKKRKENPRRAGGTARDAMKWMNRACMGLVVCSAYAGEEPFLDSVSAGVGQSQDGIDILILSVGYRF